MSAVTTTDAGSGAVLVHVDGRTVGTVRELNGWHRYWPVGGGRWSAHYCSREKAVDALAQHEAWKQETA